MNGSAAVLSSPRYELRHGLRVPSHGGAHHTFTLKESYVSYFYPGREERDVERLTRDHLGIFPDVRDGSDRQSPVSDRTPEVGAYRDVDT